MKIADSWSFEDIRLKNKELREKMAASIENNDGEAFLQQSSEFMKLNLAGLAKLNRRYPHLVKTAVERSDEENEREAMVMFHVIQTKFKSKYYVSKKQYWRDAGKDLCCGIGNKLSQCGTSHRRNGRLSDKNGLSAPGARRFSGI